ncbi:DUF1778 domain-containing protein [Rhodoferax sp.]|uniref:type II toxin-antitoxin system TacA family antitoxin n=1 Tax=Rhodoferax sp. TaxID=50421 RepID=UPI0039B9503D
MCVNTRLTVRLNASDKCVVARAAALTDTSTVEFIRAAAKEKALAVLATQTLVTLTRRDFAAFTAAINTPLQAQPRSQGGAGRSQTDQSPAMIDRGWTSTHPAVVTKPAAVALAP